MKFLSLSILLISIVSCSSTTIYAQKPQAQIDYERQHNEADKAFQELDKEIKNNSDKNSVDNKSPEIQSEQNSTLYKEKKRPIETSDKSNPNECKSGEDKPCWILNPNCIQGYTLLAVGSAKKQSGGVYAQRKSATLQARAELSRMVNIYIENELIMTEKYDRENHKNDYERYIQTQSRQRSASYFDKIAEVDCYIDNTTDNEIFIILGVK